MKGKFNWSPYKSVQDNVLAYCQHRSPSAVTAKDLQEILSGNQSVYHAMYRALEELEKKGKLEKVSRGKFRPLP